MKKLDKNMRTVLMLSAVIGVMLGIVSQAGPIYRMFCAATGLNGTTQRAEIAPASAQERMITVHFDSNVDSALPWDFEPEVRSMRVKVGEAATAKYRARNRSNRTLVGTAVHNVQPDKAGLYFSKLECFCFTKQVLEPGQATELPVQFFIDPSVAEDRAASDITDITLSYTFYLAKDQSEAKNVVQNSKSPAQPATP